MSRAVLRRLAKGVFANSAGQVVNLVIQFATIPLFFAFWGPQLFGEWMLLFAIPSYLAMSDLSFGAAAANAISMQVAQGDREAARRTYQGTWVLVTLLSSVILIAATLFVLLAPLTSWLNLSVLTEADVRAVSVVLIAQVVLSQQGSIFMCAYRGGGVYARGIMANTYLRVGEFGIGALVLWLGAGPWAYALTVLTVRLLAYAWIAADTRRRVPWLPIGWRHADLASLRPLVVPALSFNAFPLGYALNLQGLVLVVGALSTPILALLFSSLRTLVRIVWQALNVISSTVWTELSTALGAEDFPLARRLHRRACQIGFWAALPGLIALLFAGRWVYETWTGHQVAFDPVLFQLLLVGTLLNSLWAISYVVPLSVNRHGRLALYFVIVNALGLGLAWFLLPTMGLVGAAWALIAVEAAMLAYVWHRSLGIVQDQLGPFVRQLVTPPVDLLARAWGRVRRSA